MGSGGPQRGEPVIRETIVTTLGAAGRPNIAAMGVREERGLYLISPFRPSRTYDNLKRSRQAVINHTDDVRVYAGCLTGRKNWPTLPVEVVRGVRLANALAHVEVEVAEWEDDELRPRFYCRERGRVSHAEFRGFNRAQAAVIEASILVSRLHMLPAEKIDREMDYLRIAVEKTGGPRERGGLGMDAGAELPTTGATKTMQALSPPGATSPGRRRHGPARRGPG